MSFVPRCTQAATSIAVAFLSLLWADTAHALIVTTGCADINRSCTLLELTAGGRIAVGDKLFSNWFADDASTLQVNLSGIVVLPLDDQPQNPGLRFSASGNLRTLGLNQIDLDFGFSVAALTGARGVSGGSLALDQFAFGANNAGGVIEINEAILAANQALLAEMIVLADNRPPSSPTLLPLEVAAFAPQQRIVVENNILITGDARTDTSSLLVFTQRFAQQQQVSEPSGMAVATLGLAALGFVRRRRKTSDRIQHLA